MLYLLKRFNIVVLLAGLCLNLGLLTGCGGSGGSSGGGSSSSSQSPKAKSQQVSGTAVKGTISNGEVSIYAITNGVKSNLLVRTTTDNNGDYRATVPGTYSGPVLIEITANFSGTTLM
ncbi:MAG: hypothetical protein MI867_14380, partial [Pseudomonadales bacterium]|nr:hypothetical protein [Pseudomonadales bacterium]